MRILSAVMLTAMLWGTVAASGQVLTSVSQDARDVADTLGFGFTLSHIADGQKPTLDHLDEFLDLAGFGIRAGQGRRNQGLRPPDS
jgi:hypothetical protein